MQNLLEKENLLLRNKNERNLQHNADVNYKNSNFLSGEIFIPYNKTFKMPKNQINEFVPGFCRT